MDEEPFAVLARTVLLPLQAEFHSSLNRLKKIANQDFNKISPGFSRFCGQRAPGQSGASLPPIMNFQKVCFDQGPAPLHASFDLSKFNYFDLSNAYILNC